jgi:hypothetical protein
MFVSRARHKALERSYEACRQSLIQAVSEGVVLRNTVAALEMRLRHLERAPLGSKAELDLQRLVREIDMLGGMPFIQCAVEQVRRAPAAAGSPFGQEDMRRLLMLCHPDKHGGKQMAHDITAKLLKMRPA